MTDCFICWRIDITRSLPTILDRRKWPPGPLLFGLTLLAYFNSFANGFVLDDGAFIRDAGNLADTPISQILFQSYHGFYRPFAFLILRTFVAIFGPMPLLYHIVNFLLFNVICYLIYRIVAKLSASRDTGLLTAVLYAVHPVHHPLVSNCFTLCLNVYILTGLGAMWFFIRYLDKGRRKDAVLSVGLFTASLLSHLSAVTLPLIMLIIARHRIKITWPAVLKHLWPYAAALGLIVAARAAVPGTRSITSLFELGLSPARYLALLWDLLLWYHLQLIAPLRNIFLWDQPLNTPHVWVKAFGLLAGLGGMTYILIYRWRNSERGMWLAMHVAGLLPVTMAAFIYSLRTGTAIIEPLWFCLSSIGLYALAAHGLLGLKGKIPAKSFDGLVVGLAVALIFLTLGHNAKWRTERTFTSYWIAVNPLNSVPWKRWAISFIEEGNMDRLAVELVKSGDTLEHRQHHLAWTNRGHIYNILNRFNEAIADYSRALDLDPGHIDALLSRANCYAILGKYTEARMDLQRILTIDPEHQAAKRDWQLVTRELASQP